MFLRERQAGTGFKGPVRDGRNRAGADRAVHGYLCCCERTAFQGFYAGGENYGRFRLLCRRDPGKTPRGIGNHAFLPDQCGLKRGMHSIPGLWR